MVDNSWEESRRIHLQCGHSYHRKRFREILQKQNTCPVCNKQFEQRDINYFNSIENPPPRPPQTFSPFIEEQESENVYISPKTKALIDKLSCKQPSNSWSCNVQFGKRNELKKIINYLKKL
jgi:hypothetical protein